MEKGVKKSKVLGVFLFVFSFALIIAHCSMLIASVPRIISYQGYLTDIDEDPVLDGVYSIVFSIFDAETGGSALWSETRDVEVGNGLYSVNLGAVSSLDLSFDEPYWLEVEFEGTVLSPRYAMGSSPYALNSGWAESAGTAESVDWSVITGIPGEITDGDDYMSGEAAGGDLSGAYPNPALGRHSAADGQVLKWNSSLARWVAADDILGEIGDDWGTQVVQHTATLEGNGTAGAPLKVAQQGAVLNQVLKWNGTTWYPGNDLVGGSSVGSLSEVLTVGNSAGMNDINMNGNGILNIDWLSSDDGIGSNLDADYLDGMNGAYYLNWHNFTSVPADIFDGDDYMSGETAGGDLSGAYPDPTVSALQGVDISAGIPATGQVLKYDGANWSPAPDETGAGGGLWTDHTTYIGPNDNENMRIYDLDQTYSLYLDVDDFDGSGVRHGIFVYREDYDGIPYEAGTSFWYDQALANIAAYDFDAGEYNVAIGGWSYLDDNYSASVLGALYNGTMFGALGAHMDDDYYAGYFQGNVHITGDLTIAGSYPGSGGVAGGVGGSGEAGGLAFWENESTLTSYEYLYWDALNHRLGIGDACPSKNLSVPGNAYFGVLDTGVTVEIKGTNQISYHHDGIVNIGSPASWHLSLDNNEVHARNGSDPGDLYINDYGGNVFIADVGNVGIGSYAPGAKVHAVEGDMQGYLGHTTTTGSPLFTTTHNPVEGNYSGVSMGSLGRHFSSLITESYSGVYGNASSSTGTNYGVYGISSGPSLHYGIYGYTVGDSGIPVCGVRPGYTAEFGVPLNPPAGAFFGDRAVGAYSYADGGEGVYGSCSHGFGDAIGVKGYATSTVNTYGVYGQAGGTAVTKYGVYAVGNMGCSGTKSAVVRTSEGPREMYAMESPNLWFEDLGIGEISGGRCRINMKDDYYETIYIDDSHPYHVFITPRANIGNWWIEEDNEGFTLFAPDAVDGSSFHYKIAALRKGYEDLRMKRVPGNYTDHFLYPDINDVPDEYREEWLNFRENPINNAVQ
ncbi:hypothetical protein JXI42_07065 [bacterium]|nr:hypothetical protein [bacterium]